MSIKTSFSIKDLENLSGVKAHTIRIWEKRYNLFKPKRTKTNIRIYGNEELQKILNIAMLNNSGLKVSKIAMLSPTEIQLKIKELLKEENPFEEYYTAFKLSMMNFDLNLFDSTYKSLEDYSFSQIFENIFVRLLNEIGVLWHADTIKPAHEHFISTLVYQKVLLNIENIGVVEGTQDYTYILFLPPEEIHQIGLLYVHYKLLSNGFQSIFLGPSLPIADLRTIQDIYPKIEFISYFTVEPSKDKNVRYLRDIYDKILSTRNERLHIMGRKTIELNTNNNTSSFVFYKNVEEFISSKELG